MRKFLIMILMFCFWLLPGSCAESKNILLIGQDQRPGEEQMRSDCIIVATINDDEIKLTSFMRDLYVEIPGYKNNRINAAYKYGGKKLLIDTLKQNFDIDIDGTVEINFNGFINVIDELSGVDIDIKEEELSYINGCIGELNLLNGKEYHDDYLTESGLQTLNGTQALAYSRIRHIGNGDFERTSRQRTVLMEIYKKAKDLDTKQLLIMYYKLRDYVKIDLQPINIFKLALKCKKINNITTLNIPQDAKFTEKKIRGMQVLVPDIENCKEILAK